MDTLSRIKKKPRPRWIDRGSKGVLPLRIDDLLGQAQAIEHNDKWSHSLMANRLGRPADKVAEWYRGQQIRDTDFALNNGVVQEVKKLVIPPDAEFAQVGFKF